jgi:cold shock protein
MRPASNEACPVVEQLPLLLPPTSGKRDALMVTGTVTWVDPGRGCGFIACDEGGRDLFAHSSNIDDAAKPLVVGALVEFDRYQETGGRLVAANVTLRSTQAGNGQH